MAFKENLLQKIELERLALRVIASIGSAEQVSHRIDKESMRKLLELSPFHYKHERDLDLFIKDAEGDLKTILVLDNELPIFHSTVKDVVIRRSPRTLEIWKISTIRKILVDTDIKVSTGKESVETILQDSVAQLDLTYNDKDIEGLGREGMAWLAGREARGVTDTLALFAALLGLKKPPKIFGLDQTISYGTTTAGPNKEAVLGPLVIYRPPDNTLLWLDKSFGSNDRQQLNSLRSIAAGQASGPVTGDAVFEKLKTEVLKQPERVRARLATGLPG
jgi:hypothetical protein